MNKRAVFLVFLTLKISVLPVLAQFHTISADTEHLSHSSGLSEEQMMEEMASEPAEEELFSPTCQLQVRLQAGSRFEVHEVP